MAKKKSILEKVADTIFGEKEPAKEIENPFGDDTIIIEPNEVIIAEPEEIPTEAEVTESFESFESSEKEPAKEITKVSHEVPTNNRLHSHRRNPFQSY